MTNEDTFSSQVIRGVCLDGGYLDIIGAYPYVRYDQCRFENVTVRVEALLRAMFVNCYFYKCRISGNSAPFSDGNNTFYECEVMNMGARATEAENATQGK